MGLLHTYWGNLKPSQTLFYCIGELIRIDAHMSCCSIRDFHFDVINCNVWSWVSLAYNIYSAIWPWLTILIINIQNREQLRKLLYFVLLKGMHICLPFLCIHESLRLVKFKKILVFCNQILSYIKLAAEDLVLWFPCPVGLAAGCWVIILSSSLLSK